MRSSSPLPLIAAAIVLAAPASADINLARLGHEAIPTAQSVKLTLDPAQESYSGSVHIDFKVATACDTFQLNARHLTIKSLTIAAASGAVSSTWNPAPFERVTVHAAQRLAPGAYTLDAEFTTAFDTKAVGLYRLKSDDDWYAFTQMESDDARQAFPCWDEPEFKIPWRLEITAPKSCVVIGNTPVESTVAEGDLNRVTFARTPPMPSYLVAFAVGPFESVPIPGMSIPSRIYTVKGQSGLTSMAVGMTPPILAALERYFGRPYPFAKLDFIAIPEYNWGAMENPGAVTFLDRVMLIDPKAATVEQRRFLSTTIAHELAHMWFGDLVTMEWWDDLWLNESFAEWMGNKISDQVSPDFKMSIATLEGTVRAYREDDQLSTHAMRQRVDEYVNLEQMADALAYQKGEAVLGMMESWVGTEPFRKGVIDYLKAHEWGNARAEDLWRALSKAAGADLGAVMSTFLDQPGAPIVSAELAAGNQVKLSQRRFLPYGQTAPAPQLWKIPVVLRFSDGKKLYSQRVLLSEATQTVKLKPAVTVAWLHPNADERGYYHWSVSPEMMAALSGEGRTALTDRERVGFVHNLGSLLEAGDLHGDEYLSAISGFGADPAPQVVLAVLESMRGVRLAVVTPELRPGFAVYVRRTFRPALERVGETPKPGEDPNVTELRPRLMTLLGNDGQDEALQRKGQEMVRAYFADPQSVDPSLVDAALRLAGSRGDTTLYYECRRRFENAKTPNDRRRFLGSLGNFRDSSLIDETLRYMLDGPLRPQEMLGAFRGVDNPEMQDHLWTWAQQNYDRIAARIPPVFRVYLPYMASGCSRERIESVKAFFAIAEHAPLGTDKTVAQVVDQIGTCVSLREREGARVAHMLNQLAVTQ